MPFFILKTLLFCAFLLTWVVLGLASISLIWRNKHKKDLAILLAPILLIYWGLTSYSTWYENFFLLQRTSLLPTLYCWGLTFLPPLLYFFIRFRITGIFPQKSQWWKHLLPSILLSCCYILMSVLSPVTDRLTYSWAEILSSSPAWWTLFRLTCIITGITQTFIYVLLLRNMNETDCISLKSAPDIQRKSILISGFFFIFLLNMLTSSYICNILYNLYIAVLGGYIFYNSLLHQVIKQKLKLHIYRETLSPLPVNNLNQQQESKSEKDVVEKEVLINGKKNSKVYLTPQKINEINQLLQTPEFIYDQKIKLELFAQRVAVNSTYLNRYFNQEYGCSFLQYLTSLRIEQAEMLLRDSNAEIGDICYNTGFNSPSAFHKAFKNRYGCSPSEWRRRCLTEKLNAAVQ
ncbi:AraC family transcriptional regulator [Bacteroides cellulosilyticus]|nr:AraC family transcriptional regulator [Bacteroides cellulosilyticus]MBV3665645.1 AraC family transcriptional regulator [Bacteroides cellulosilyticus]MBV3687742.1 AraC family transcriptional regulator [Bacteroides cellulosilyticus]MBV3696414.1 AraC family transcriptional regulator [Bacteroides cellulosilyticus]MBV3710008.1 AraC family transcriptional regulator [Bacteroides cellulosilyticus]